MLYPERRDGPREGDDVKPYGLLNPEPAEIGVGRSHDTPYLGGSDRRSRSAVVRIAARLHLDDDRCPVFLGHDVQLFVPRPPVAVADEVSVGRQIVYRRFFSGFSEQIMLCHLLVFLQNYDYFCNPV